MPTDSRAPYASVSSERLLDGVSGTLVKVETTGLDPEQDHVIVVGMLSGQFLTLVRAYPQPPPGSQTKSFYGQPEFQRFVRDLFGRTSGPFYAFNSPFDRRFLWHDLGVQTLDEKWRDLLAPFARAADRAGRLFPKLDDLVSTPQDIDPFRYLRPNTPPVRGIDIPILWKQYCELGDMLAVESIIEHCRSTLIREQLLLTLYGVDFFEPPEVAP